ncbi:hypothetical protein [Haloferula rosea]|uniref:Glycosyl hydrolase family 67 n=1 Tax=Haloferula rosea TaxID=490093 RepID=A0A934RB31_9BACT|nr:hypothetical protein [Haloferula rosea]MBK1826498.1 hypothetical protein [Haloferula rosea]
MPLRLFLIDAIGPFFRGYGKRRINWSKIPFTHLATTGETRRTQWARIRHDLRRFAAEVSAMGYNAVTLDDLAHLAPHPLHEPEIAARIEVFREEFTQLFAILHEFDLKIYLTSDIIPLTPAIDAAIGDDREALELYFLDLVDRLLTDFPELSGLILRIGESDGVDVKDPIHTRLHLTSPQQTHAMLRRLLPVFEEKERDLILRTWTVGAYPIGDLIWHRQTLARALEGIDSPRFIVSMKHGESDFFRFLPLNRAFFRISQPTIIELQARREYEGAGECPAPIGPDCERFARELEESGNLIGMSVWCQTGGWHRFRRLPFLEEAGDDSWVRINVQLAIRIFRDRASVESALSSMFPPDKADAVAELLRHAETIYRDLIYIEEFARQKLFFRRVRIPPILHIYWDCLFINHAARKLMRHFVTDPERALRSGEAAYSLFPRMIELARTAGLPATDIEHWRDFCNLVRLARRYYFLPYDEALLDRIRSAKSGYKRAWPREVRSRYRIKLSFQPFKLKRRTLGWLSSLLLRRQRGYRWIDQVFTLNLLGMMFRLIKTSNPKVLPKFLRKSAMGVETLFR